MTSCSSLKCCCRCCCARCCRGCPGRRRPGAQAAQPRPPRLQSVPQAGDVDVVQAFPRMTLATHGKLNLEVLRSR
eukprot:907125-Lingulodinium_polyedra.AAC.1